MKKAIVTFAALAVGATAALAATALREKILKKAKTPEYVTPKDTYERAEQAEQVSVDYYQAVRTAYDDGPNANPVYSAKVETPLTEDGKIDVTKLASPEDFCNWEEHGCQS